MLIVETTVAAGNWSAAVDWAALATRACDAALAQTPHAGIAQARFEAEVSVRLSDDGEVRQLNRQYRDKDRPTNVLSFPLVQPDLIEALADTDDGETLLGDIVLAAETVAAEAMTESIAVEAHAAHLIVHGMLHLLGYDHGDDQQAEHMEGLESASCSALGLADPYATLK